MLMDRPFLIFHSLLSKCCSFVSRTQLDVQSSNFFAIFLFLDLEFHIMLLGFYFDKGNIFTNLFRGVLVWHPSTIFFELPEFYKALLNFLF